MGLPGLCGFIGEVLVTLSVWNFSHAAGDHFRGGGDSDGRLHLVDHCSAFIWGPNTRARTATICTPITPRELAIAVPLLCFAILFGVYPQAIFNYMEPTVTQQVKELATWTRTVHDSPADGIRPEAMPPLRPESAPAKWHAAAKPSEKLR